MLSEKESSIGWHEAVTDTDCHECTGRTQAQTEWSEQKTFIGYKTKGKTHNGAKQKYIKNKTLPTSGQN